MYIILHKNKYTKCVIKINKLFKMERIELKLFLENCSKKGLFVSQKGHLENPEG